MVACGESKSLEVPIAKTFLGHCLRVDEYVSNVIVVLLLL